MITQPLGICLPLFISRALAANFTISNGQIFTPGFAVLDAPQPNTPLGGDQIEVALDVTANGKLDLPPYTDDGPSQIFNITIFMYSYDTQRNFTITNGTASANNASLGDIMESESGSTVKHVKWQWPDCLVGDGQPTSTGSDRGNYNVSIRQNFRFNGEDHYTIFDVPISVTNSIPSNGNPSCDSLNNPLLTPEQINATAANSMGAMFAPGDATQVEATYPHFNSKGEGLGGSRPEATPEDGLGGARSLGRSSAAGWISLLSVVFAFLS